MAADPTLTQGAAGAGRGVSRGTTVTGWIAAPPGVVFALITDVDRLPEWNTVVRKVLERPARMAVGAEWVVRIRPPKFPSWPSRSTCLELDPEHGVFAHRSRSDDGNPSWADWRWELGEEDGGTRIAVSYALNPRSWWRTVLFSRLRHSQLGNTEIRDSIAALGRALGATTRSN